MGWLRGLAFAVWSAVGFAFIPGAAASCGQVFEAPEELIDQLRTGNAWAAYDGLSERYRQDHGFRAFVVSITALGLDQATFQIWCTRSVDDGRAIVDGHVTVAARRGVPMEVDLVETADGTWVVDDFSTQVRPGPINRPFALFPTREQAADMVSQSIDLVGTAVAENDLDVLRNALVTPFRRRINTERLSEMLEPLDEIDTDIRLFAAVPPVFLSSPRLISGIILDLSGYVPVQPHPLLFRFLYVREDGDWRLLWLALGQTELPDAPAEIEDFGAPI